MATRQTAKKFAASPGKKHDLLTKVSPAKVHTAPVKPPPSPGRANGMTKDEPSPGKNKRPSPFQSPAKVESSPAKRSKQAKAGSPEPPAKAEVKSDVSLENQPPVKQLGKLII